MPRNCACARGGKGERCTSADLTHSHESRRLYPYRQQRGRTEKGKQLTFERSKSLSSCPAQKSKDDAEMERRKLLNLHRCDANVTIWVLVARQKMRFSNEKHCFESRNVKIRYVFRVEMKIRSKMFMLEFYYLSLPLRFYSIKRVCKIYDFGMRLFWMLVRLKVGP